MEKFKITILSPERQFFAGEVVSVAMPSLMGEMEIFANHAPILSVLAAGYIIIKISASEHKKLFITGGYLDISDNVTIIVDKIIDENDVTNQLLETEKNDAVAILEKQNLSDAQYEYATDKLARYTQLAANKH